MGVQISEIVPKKEIQLEFLSGKIIAVDSLNMLYQFLTTIRQVDGTPLMDSKGQVTSHLSGLFYRITNLMTKNIQMAFIFDGKPPKLKFQTSEKRQQKKAEAEKKYQEAKKAKAIEDMGKYAKQLTKLDDKMLEESKTLLKALGLPVIQAPSEGEAQAAFICKQKHAYATASQDFDALLFSSPLLIQNLTLARKKRLASGAFTEIKPELIELKKALNSLELTQKQLLILATLIGTDYNPGGYKGIGPKKALKLIKEQKTPAKIFKKAEDLAKNNISFNPQEIIETFEKIPVTKNYKIQFKKPNEKILKQLLCKKHEFAQQRIENALERLQKSQEAAKQTGLDSWL